MILYQFSRPGDRAVLASAFILHASLQTRTPQTPRRLPSVIFITIRHPCCRWPHVWSVYTQVLS